MSPEVVAVPRGERPLEPGDGVVLRFARDLRLLRDKAGSPTYRELSARAHFSAAVLSEAASGRKLPSLQVAMAYVAACGGDTAEWETRWRATAAELAATKTDDDDAQPPYVGLASFQREDADRFYGREKLVADLANRLRRRRFLGVLGPSGCGKSSLLRAGLVARLAEEQDNVVVFTPGQHPIEECAVHLAGPLDESPATLRAEFSADPRNLHLRIRKAVAGGGSDFVLVVDQFEELFTLCGDERERASFIDAVVTAATDPASRARTVLGIRADFLGHCGHHPQLVDALRDAQVLVGAMTTDELRTAITGPAERAGYRVETALVARLVADANRQAGMLPLVSHALLQTWLRRRGTVMTMAGYDAAGGIEHALARSAEEIYQSLDAGQQNLAKQVFLRLTALGEGTEDTKRRIPRDELDNDDPHTVLVLETLARKRLVTVGHDSVEIAHEALIRHWPRLRDWLAEDREGHRLQRQLTEAATEWARSGRDDGVLHRGTRLTAWQDRPLDQLNDTERAFLTASRNAEARAHRARRRRVWWTIGGLSTTTAVVTVLAVIALVLAARAEDERTLAVGRQLVADARAQLQVDPELGLLLAREAFARAPNDDTESVLRQAVADSHVRATLPAHSVGPSGSRAVSGVAFSADGGHLVITDTGGTFQVWDWQDGQVTRPRVLRGNLSIEGPVFSQDGTHLAAASPSGVVLVRDWVRRGRPVTLTGDQGGVSSVAFSPDGRHLVSGGQDGTIWLRDVAGDGRPVVLDAHEGRVSEVAFTSDGRLVSSGHDGTVRVWDLAGGGNPVTLRNPEGGVESVASRPDGHVASADAAGTVRTWDPRNANGSVVLGFHDYGAYDVAYSADGHWLASVGVDPTVRIWNADQPAEPVVLRGHRGAVTAAAFSPDGGTVVSASLDGTAKVWAVDEVADVAVRRGHRGPVTCVAPSPDGRRMASGGQDGTVRIWDVAGAGEPLVLSGTGGPVEQVTFSPDGRYLAAATIDGTVLVWHPRDSAVPVWLGKPEGPVAGIAFGPDGRQLTAADQNDGSLRIWDLPRAGRADPPTTVLLPGSDQALLGVAWSPDRRRLATATDNTVLLRDLSGSAEPVVLDGHQSLVQTIAFSHDGSHLASAGNDGTIQVWNLADDSGPTVLHGKQDVVWNAAYSVDGRQLVTSGSDNTIRIWRTDGAGEPLVLDGFRATVRAVAPLTGDRYATAHGDGTVRTWRCPSCGDIAQVLARASRHVTRGLTERERQTFLHKGS